jgi:subtilase family serine protease
MAGLLCFQGLLLAQGSRISEKIDNHRRMKLAGHVHPQARPEFDQGRVASSLVMRHLTLVLKPSASQQADLDKLLADQQNPSSPLYHHWLRPDEYAARFGASQDDLDKIVAWLQSQNLTVDSVARARNTIAFTGTAADVDNAFGTEIHRYQVNGESHYANATEPSIPAALQAVVSTIHGLTDFRLQPPKTSARATAPALRPDYTSTSGVHYIAPDDMAVMYNIRSLYNAGINGDGQKIAVMGQTQINLPDIQQFRSYFNLPANDPQVVLVPDTRDPGVVRDDLAEADLDVEWSGAIARNATIIYVYSRDVMDAVQYAIDQNLAPVLSMSYGLCEALTSSADAATLQSWARQANAQGMTWFAASGDSGGADCYDGTMRTRSLGLSVDIPASIPEVTGVGGTQLLDTSGTYWNTSGDANHASALSYIPETTWNDSTLEGSPSATGGGASTYFPKPSWQTGAGVPGDNARDVPDVALPASPSHVGYLFITGGNLKVVGGTSAGSPTYAGIAALLNHYLTANGLQAAPGLGNMNPRLYSLAQSTPSAFHDITTGDNMVTICTGRVRFCTTDATPIGFSAGAGYDQVTGLGSPDVYNMVTSWHSASGTQAHVVMSLTSNTDNLGPADTALLTASVQSDNGGTPTGIVTFYLGDASLGTAPLSGSGNTATATITVTAAQLNVAGATISAQYGGDGSYSAASSSVTLAAAQPSVPE